MNTVYHFLLNKIKNKLSLENKKQTMKKHYIVQKYLKKNLKVDLDELNEIDNYS